VDGVRELVSCGKPYRHGLIQAAIQDAEKCEADVIVKTKAVLRRVGAGSHLDRPTPATFLAFMHARSSGI
jgi:hypothetical protein